MKSFSTSPANGKPIDDRQLVVVVVNAEPARETGRMRASGSVAAQQPHAEGMKRDTRGAESSVSPAAPQPVRASRGRFVSESYGQDADGGTCRETMICAMRA